jgi:hypothetical protein
LPGMLSAPILPGKAIAALPRAAAHVWLQS